MATTLAPSPAFYIAVTLYGLASLLYISSFTKLPKLWQTMAIGSMALAFVAHGVDIGWRGVEHVHPGMSIREALGFVSWVITGFYLLASFKGKLRLLGAFIAPLIGGVLAAARLTPSGEVATEISMLGRIHITLATLGVGIFVLATMVALTYLFQERNLKNKQFDGVLFKKGMALESLDRSAHLMVLVGFPIFSCAILLGVIWLSQLSLNILARPEHPLAIITWLNFAALIFVRTTMGWRGRRAALLTLAGCAVAVLVLGIYFVRGMVGV